VDSSRPFPLIRNKTLNIGALISNRKKEKKELEFATVQVPGVLPRVIEIPSKDEKKTIILLEEVIERNIGKLFLNYDSSGKAEAAQPRAATNHAWADPSVITPMPISAGQRPLTATAACAAPCLTWAVLLPWRMVYRLILWGNPGTVPTGSVLSVVTGVADSAARTAACTTAFSVIRLLPPIC
ncbi:MAG: hypothetical protein IJ993_02360, partial [Akkermansia sp.]|nr:hypothetical protein [Akkermansia sp.]